MEKLAARAALVPAPGVSQGIATSISRSEIEEVLASDGEPIQLVLDVKRFSDGEGSESHTVAISWERSDLERLLEEAAGDQVVLTFDGEALRQTYARTGTAVAASGMTAIAGFAVLIASEIAMLREFGIVTVVDLAVALLGVMVVLPAALVWAEGGYEPFGRWVAPARRRQRAPG